MTTDDLLQEAVACIREIADPIKFMRDRLNDGEQLNGGYAISLSNDPEFLKKIARTFLAKIDAAKGEVPDDVAKYRHHLELLRDDCTYPSGHVGAVVLNGHRMEIIRDALTAILAANKENSSDPT